MDNLAVNRKTGGMYMLETVGSTPIFSHEQLNDEQKEIQKMVENFVTEKVYPLNKQIESKDLELTKQLIREMGELGLLSIDIPEKLGGMEMDKVTGIVVAEALSYGGSGSFTVSASTQTGIGMLPIIWFGSKEQQEKYLPKLATGELIGAYALTEPEAGSDATSGKTIAKLSDDGKQYTLNGEKQFITNGGIADIYTLFAQVDGNKFSAFIVERNMEGFEVGPEEHKLGSKGSSTTPLKLTNVNVPVENLLGNVGDGASIAFNVLNQGRLKLGAHVLGGCKLIISKTCEYALERRQFGQPIAFFDAIKKKFADMTIRTYALDSLIYRAIAEIQSTVEELDKSAPDYYVKMGQTMEKFAIESSTSKVMGSEAIGFCADQGIQIFGGYGYIEEYPLAKIYRDCRIDRIWEGTNEINRQIITGYFMKKALLNEIPVREGIETVLFLYGVFVNQGGVSFFSSIIGAGAALGIGYMIFVKGQRVPLKTFFNVSSLFLIFVAAGMMAYGIHELESAGIVADTGRIWDLNPAVLADGSYPALHDKGSIGAIAKGLFGWNGDPSYLEVGIWAITLGGLLFTWRRIISAPRPL